VEPIRFYSTAGEHGYLSNFSPHAIERRGVVWLTAEHFFQAQKFAGTEHEQAIRTAPSPMTAARMGRSRERPLRADWEAAKEHVMLEALRAKFTQHVELGRRLLETGDARLIEHTANDRYWADGGDGTGRNRLGALLEQVRSELADGLEHAEAWSKVMKPGRDWVAFLFGTCVVVPSGEREPKAAALALLAERGPVVAGTPSGDFNVSEMPAEFGWLVSFDHPDILARVSRATAGASPDMVIGLTGRAARARDAEALAVVRASRVGEPAR